MWDISIFGYSLYELFWFFTIYSVLGWCSEVIFCTVNTGKLVNRGFLNGPVCPIYGFGMLIVLCVLRPVQDHLTLLFVGGALLTSALELGAGYALKTLFHTQWWDYSDKPFNLGGYICLSFSLLWGLLIVMVVKVIHPPIAQLVAMVPRVLGELVAVPVLLIFLADLVVTVHTVAKLNRDLGELEKVTDTLHRMSDALSTALGEKSLEAAAAVGDAGQLLGEKLGETRTALTEKGQELTERLDETRNALTEKGQEFTEKLGDTRAAISAATSKEELQKRYAELQKRYTELLGRPGRARRRLFSAFPDMKNPLHSNVLEELKEKYRRK